MKTIGKLAKELDINIETIRFYEKKGLISQPIKPENGYRLYSSAIADKLRFIAKAKALGFTLKEISSLMSMENNCAQVESLGLQKLDIIRNKIFDLQRLESVISKMTNSCKTNQDQYSCPIIDSLK
ncbi:MULTISPECIES: MerR family transcriptional regulator [unclassified Colwellia]|uniref:MerR family transcriptional regulator n=1 Tax=unclassified Colwellia TaxID=196834 RepID=UPI0015F669F0|nr:MULTISPECIES: MerR family transcriptional regulator [unclassified Colwellia]MBA6346797.1 MerR family transcriptional regulator [Colwellia sp. BRX8-9]MBA6353478.1 MerR family transcriptional regulator [Colwellia sp. BRX9-1]MBA6357683.1 MerR family transcriptional regulator [Colwellia sp. BRX8-3]MBA6359836.1 MerR family transcriptional regulator [Colwellia sp. BRX8-6]MBA6368356.1 MerR family transcriptional regulator [Colwellia sp. BRX8-5]